MTHVRQIIPRGSGALEVLATEAVGVFFHTALGARNDDDDAPALAPACCMHPGRFHAVHGTHAFTCGHVGALEAAGASTTYRHSSAHVPSSRPTVESTLIGRSRANHRTRHDAICAALDDGYRRSAVHWR
jgi:hypothetical protein